MHLYFIDLFVKVIYLFIFGLLGFEVLFYFFLVFVLLSLTCENVFDLFFFMLKFLLDFL